MAELGHDSSAEVVAPRTQGLETAPASALEAGKTVHLVAIRMTDQILKPFLRLTIVGMSATVEWMLVGLVRVADARLKRKARQNCTKMPKRSF